MMDENWLPDVRLHVFGHIHEAWGAQIITRYPPPNFYGEKDEDSDSDTENAATGGETQTRQPRPPTPRRRRRVRPVETVFVNAAIDKMGSQAIIVDLRDEFDDTGNHDKEA
jgi:hypothetical protein